MEQKLPQDEPTTSPIETVQRIFDAFNRHDVDGIMAATTEDCLIESTVPPDGERYEGQAASRVFWDEFFRSSPNAAFEIEETFATGDRCVVRWLYRWVDGDGKQGHVRGVDLFRVRKGRCPKIFPT